MGAPARDRPALALHALVAVAGGVLAAVSAVAGVAVLAATALSLVLDLRGGPWLLRRLTLRRATQNVVSPPPTRPGEQAQPPIRLVITARYDAGRTGLVRRPALQRLAARAPGARALLLLLAVLLALAAAAARLAVRRELGRRRAARAHGRAAPGGRAAGRQRDQRALAGGERRQRGRRGARARRSVGRVAAERLAVHVVLAGAGSAPAAGLRVASCALAAGAGPRRTSRCSTSSRAPAGARGGG